MYEEVIARYYDIGAELQNANHYDEATAT